VSSGGPYPYQYTWAQARPQRRAFSTSRREVLQLGVAFLVLTFDFVLILYVGGPFFGNGLGTLLHVPLWLVLVAVSAALSAFVAHEMAHKVSAQRSGYWAEFRWSPAGLAFSVLTAYFGWLFAAPGATLVHGMADPKQWGRTSLAGPMTNVTFAGVFYLGSVGLWLSGSSYFGWLLFLAWVNGFFAVFNLLPVGPLDGAKVLNAGRGMWVGAFVVAVGAAVICYLALAVFVSPLL
jgi:Zn-dependent protease